MGPKSCSICLTPNDILIRVSLEYEDNLTILQKLQIVAPFQDWLNCYSICQNCKNLLDTSYYFIDMCSKYEENQRKLAQKQNEDSIKSIESDEEKNDFSENLGNCTDDSGEQIVAEYVIPNDITNEVQMEGEYTKINEDDDEEHMQEECITINIDPEIDTPENKNKKDTGSTVYTEDLQCIHCDTKFSSYIKLGMHIKFEHGYKCTLCAEVFANEDKLEKHIKNGHPGYADKFTCEVCNEKFVLASELIRHCESVHSMEKNTIRPYSCSICDKRVTTLGSFKRHLLYHGETRGFTCKFCGKNFVTKKELTEHEKIHLNEKKYGCEKCDKRFNTYSNLRTHNFCVHSDPNKWKYACDVCPKRFPLKKNFTDHMNRHYGIKEYQCFVCGALFIAKYDLERHMYYHTKDRPHKCKFCKDKSYRDRKGLRFHMVKCHGDVEFK